MLINFTKNVVQRFSILGRSISAPVLLAILLLAAGTLFVGGDYVLLEQYQAAIFPLIVVLFYYLPKSAKLRFPPVVVVVVLAAGIASALEIRGYLPIFFGSDGGIIIELSNGEGAHSTRERYRNYNLLAKRYDFPPLHLIQDSEESSSAALELLSRQPKGLVLISGDALWPRVTFRSDTSAYKIPSAKVELSTAEQATLTNLGLDPETDLSVVWINDLKLSLALQVVPESFQLPSRNTEIADRLLGWMLRGLASSSSEKKGQLREILARQQDSFREAAFVIGHWPSGGPKAAASLLLADSYLLEHLNVEAIPAITKCALAGYGRAAGLTHQKAEPFVYASIFNNAAIAQLLTEDSFDQVDRVVDWLGRASSVVDSEGRAVRGARIAMFNLIQLRRAGLAK